MEELYQDIILEHNKRPRNYGPLQEATHSADGHNPLCGDEMKVTMRILGNEIQAVHFQGQGCAISKASASLMTEVLSGKARDDARKIAEQVLISLKSGNQEMLMERDGELAALSGVKKFPARIKCATLAWHAFLSALDRGESISTE